MINLLAQAGGESVFSGAWWKDLFDPSSGLWQLTVSAVLTVGLYSLLYRENKFYRFVEHTFVGLGVGFSVVAIWSEVLYPHWWQPLVGQPPSDGQPMQLAYWPWAVLLPIGFLAFLIFSKKHGWLSRIPIGLIIGLWAGQQLGAFANRFLPQVANQARPLIPNQFTTYDPSYPPGTVTVPEAINNLIVVVTWVVVLSYFLYSFEQRSRLIQRSSTAGRWLLMVGFGAIFGTTMMTRFVLFIDRAYFLLAEWLRIAEPL